MQQYFNKRQKRMRKTTQLSSIERAIYYFKSKGFDKNDYIKIAGKRYNTQFTYERVDY